MDLIMPAGLMMIARAFHDDACRSHSTKEAFQLLNMLLDGRLEFL
jgi:hypothetical protein